MQCGRCGRAIKKNEEYWLEFEWGTYECMDCDKKYNKEEKGG